ncbi:Lipopolysaccharide biosynthesis protein-like protein [Elusimicrobium minutum Pei191]|uniref:Lipopolysaccharide biosynthesis protein-like protein n=1 Tax=Elusimicrobium minutum (strain Pei191) TaxID=445932 RepID=B2KD25_ELUMP|nr:lipopolysaccharide biosynthesis protein-like protein [Elusimicrobium minutum]ACC98421.1 Lipopolysaccharide biosynthesis protein-like protein [Elusimicrobium minutum Pei191]
MKRIALLAGYHKKGLISDYVVYYAKELAKISDVYYFADSEMKSGELEKLAPYVKFAGAKRHENYDVGSWQQIINMLGWDAISQYDELILCNDSCFVPVHDLKPIFDKASAQQDCDFWAMGKGYDWDSKTWHLYGYFMVYKQKVTQNAVFRNAISGFKIDKSWENICPFSEFIWTQMFIEEGFKPKTAFDFKDNLGHSWRTYIKNGMPIFKIKIFTKFAFELNTESLAGWQKFLKENTDYDPKLIENHLKSINVPYKSSYYFFHSKNIKRAIRKIRRWFFYSNKKHGNDILRIFGIYIRNKNVDFDTTIYEDNSIPLL